MIINYDLEFFIYEQLPDLTKRVNDEFNLMAVVCWISYDVKTRRIYLFVPSEVILTFYDNVDETVFQVKFSMVYNQKRLFKCHSLVLP